MAEFIDRYRSSLLSAIEAIDGAQVDKAIQLLREARIEGRMIYVCGNGGSATSASHFATDMAKGASFGRPVRFRVLSLSESLPTITAYSNDVSYESVFVEQLKNFARPGDVLIAISGSGNSPNVLRAVEFANLCGLRTIALTGHAGGSLGPLAHLEINVAASHMGRIEDSHLVILHMISYYFMEAEDHVNDPVPENRPTDGRGAGEQASRGPAF